MKNKRKISLLLIAVMLIGLLSGCTSAEKVAAKTFDAMAGKTLTHAKFTMPFSMRMEAEGEELEIDLELEGEFWQSEDPAALYAVVNYEGDLGDQWLSDRVEIYMTKEEETYVMYFYDKTADIWFRMDSGMTDEDYAKAAEMEFKLSAEDFDLEALVLAEDTVTVGGSEAYVLNYTFAGQLLQDWWDEQGDLSEMMDTAMESAELPEGTAELLEGIDFSSLVDVDLSVLSVPVTLYVDKSTYTIKQLDMEYVGMQNLIEQLMDNVMNFAADILKTQGLELTEDILGAVPSFEIPTIKISLTDMSYDPVEVKAVPEEGIIRGKQQSFDPLQEDGSYVLQESGDAVHIVPQKDREVAYAAYNTLQLTGLKGGTQTVYTMLDKSWTEEDFMAYVESNLEAIQVDRPNAKIIDEEYEGYTVKGVKFGNIVIYYAWRHVGDGWLLVETFNIYTQLDYQILWPALEAVSDYTLS